MGTRIEGGMLAAGLLAGLVAWGGAAAEQIVRDGDGRRILLHDDHTWEYLDAEVPEERVVLSVERLDSGPNHCTVGLRLENLLGEEVRSLVPQFSAFTEGDVRFETVFQSFSWIKPTQDQYQEIRFSGISCDGIERVQVHGADRCSMGDLSKFSFERGECLRHIEVVRSPLIQIGK
jgi:hypothetical protein